MGLFGKKKWIQNAVKNPGALHRSLGVPQGHKIPMEELRKHLHDKGKMGQRARFAMTMKNINK